MCTRVFSLSFTVHHRTTATTFMDTNVFLAASKWPTRYACVLYFLDSATRLSFFSPFSPVCINDADDDDVRGVPQMQFRNPLVVLEGLKC